MDTNPTLHTAIIALGSNLGDRLAHLRQARQHLAAILHDLQASPVYETAPWGVKEQRNFYNQVVMGRTALTPLALLAHLQAIEQAMGRQRSLRFGPRTIDLDILFYDQLVLTTYRLTIPHPRLVDRAFVLVPLADIAPEWQHPRLGCSVRALLARLDTSGVWPLHDAATPEPSEEEKADRRSQIEE